MVKERDEQMTAAEEKEREEKDRQRREWWAKFKRRASALFAWAVMLSVLGGIGGYGYFNGWFCKWGVGKSCNGNSQSEPQPKPPELAEIFDIIEGKPDPVGVKDSVLSGKDCNAIEATEFDSKFEYTCEDVFFITNRAADSQESFGSESSGNYSFGSAAMVIPNLDLNESDPIKVYRGSRKTRKRLETTNEIDPAYLTIKKFSDKSDPSYLGVTRLGSDECTDNGFEITEACEFAQLLGVAGFSSYGSTNEGNDIAQERFIDEIRPEIERSNGTVLLYIHGYNTDFRTSLRNAAHVKHDLAAKIDLDDAAMDNLIGLPIAVSWPSLPDHGLSVETLDSYYLSQVRALDASQMLTALVATLARDSSVKRINIVAHSMGNRVLAEALTDIVKAYQNSEGNNIEFHIVSLAGDYAQDQFEDLVATLDDIPYKTRRWSGQFTNYFSETDFALAVSYVAQAVKQLWYNNQETFAKSAPDSFYSRVNIIMSGIEKSLADRGYPQQKLFFVDSVCRIGSQVSFFFDDDYPELGELSDEDFLGQLKLLMKGLDYAVKECKPFVDDTGTVKTVNASGYGTDSFRHGYFETSPMILAETACALRNNDPNDRRRALKQQSYLVWFFKNQKYWKIDPNRGSDECKFIGDREITYWVTYDPPKPAEELTVLNIIPVGEAYWSFKDTDSWTRPDAEQVWPLSSLIPNVVARNDTQLCNSDLLVSVGLTSREGPRESNEALADERAAALATSLRSSLRGNCQIPPRVLEFSFGQACEGECVDGKTLKEAEAESSYLERPVVILALSGVKNRNERDVKTALRKFLGNPPYLPEANLPQIQYSGLD